MALPESLYSTAQVRALDAHAINEVGIPGYELMQRAGAAALRYLRIRWPLAHELAVVCGGGNNGGDGYVVARLARAAGLNASVLAVVPPQKLQGDAATAFADYRDSSGPIKPYSPALLAGADVIVDALLGTGLSGRVREDMARVIRDINSASRAVLAIDVPSGLDSDSGMPLGDAVRADCTVSFVGLKTGLFLGEGPQWSGTVFFDALEVSPPATAVFVPKLTRIVPEEIRAALPRRGLAANKGDFGRVLIVGGGPGMPGAARMAGEACLRVGAGLVTVATAAENVAAIAAGRPELICLPLTGDEEALAAALAHATVVAIGPGLGQSPWARAALAQVLGCGKPLVVDADALNLIASAAPEPHENWILTPHPGEAGRLLGTSAAEVQRDRLGALERLIERYHGVVVLKGAGTLVGAAGRTPGICERGNPGMASAGMGDVLTGAITGILAQCRDPWVAARTGVLAHAMAGDAAAHDGERGLIATDVAALLRPCVNP